MSTRQRTVGVIYRRYQPVPENNNQNRNRPQKIDVAISVLWRLRSHFSRLIPDSHFRPPLIKYLPFADFNQ